MAPRSRLPSLGPVGGYKRPARETKQTRGAGRGLGVPRQFQLLPILPA